MTVAPRPPSGQGQGQQADRLVAAVGVLLTDLAKADRMMEQQRCLVARSHVDLAEQLRIRPGEPFDDVVVEALADAQAAVGRVDGDSVEVDEVVVVDD